MIWPEGTSRNLHPQDRVLGFPTVNTQKCRAVSVNAIKCYIQIQDFWERFPGLRLVSGRGVDRLHWARVKLLLV